MRILPFLLQYCSDSGHSDQEREKDGWYYEECRKFNRAVSMIILIIGAGGAFSQVLKESNVTEYIRTVATGIQMNPLLMAFCVAAIIRLAIGSATVSTLTTAPLMLPIAQQTGTSRSWWYLRPEPEALCGRTLMIPDSGCSRSISTLQLNRHSWAGQWWNV